MEWLFLRAGLSRSLYGSFDTTTGMSDAVTVSGVTTSVSTSGNSNGSTVNPLAAAFGWGIGIGDLHVDGVVRTELLYLTAFLASGVPNEVSARLSATYGFASGIGGGRTRTRGGK